jgi:hypothetical protein
MSDEKQIEKALLDAVQSGDADTVQKCIMRGAKNVTEALIKTFSNNNVPFDNRIPHICILNGADVTVALRDALTNNNVALGAINGCSDREVQAAISLSMSTKR